MNLAGWFSVAVVTAAGESLVEAGEELLRLLIATDCVAPNFMRLMSVTCRSAAA